MRRTRQASSSWTSWAGGMGGQIAVDMAVSRRSDLKRRKVTLEDRS